MKMQRMAATARQYIPSTTLPQHGSRGTAPTHDHSTSTNYCTQCLLRQPSPWCSGTAASLCSHSHAVSAQGWRNIPIELLRSVLRVLKFSTANCSSATPRVAVVTRSARPKSPATEPRRKQIELVRSPDVLTLRLSATKPRPKLPVAPRRVAYCCSAV